MIEGTLKICWQIYLVRKCTEAGKNHVQLGNRTLPQCLEARYNNTFPIDVYGFMVAKNVFIYLSKLAMELNLIAIESLHNCSDA